MTEYLPEKMVCGKKTLLLLTLAAVGANVED